MAESDRDIRIDRSVCVVCGACAAICPTEALVVEGLVLVVRPGRCRPCGLGALVCPTGALACPGGAARRGARAAGSTVGGSRGGGEASEDSRGEGPLDERSG